MSTSTFGYDRLARKNDSWTAQPMQLAAGFKRYHSDVFVCGYEGSQGNVG